MIKAMNIWKFRLLTQKLNKLLPSIRRQCNCKYTTKVVKTESSEELGNESQPIKFTSSAAIKHKASYSRSGGKIDDRLWYEPHVIIGSIIVFLIYFTMIREENDVDKELGRSLYSRIEGLEAVQLKANLEFNRQHGKSTEDIELRLKEIEMEKLAKTQSIKMA